jgi:copper chaperone NosL
MNLLKKLLIIVFTVSLFNCNTSPEAIEYGVDGCHFCKMTIVDKIHAAEIVTKKGKVYKFDSSECMINFLKEFDASQVKLYLSNSFSEPEKLIDATKATYLISKNIPSPMGAFLTAFKTKDEATKIQLEKEGTIFGWDTINDYLNK